MEGGTGISSGLQISYVVKFHGTSILWGKEHEWSLTDYSVWEDNEETMSWIILDYKKVTEGHLGG